MSFSKKSRSTSLLLTFFLGPIGLLYASVMWGIVLIILAVATMGTIIIPVLCWVMSMLIGDAYVNDHNKSLEEFKNDIKGS